MLSGGIPGWGTKVNNKFWLISSRKMVSSNLTLSQQKKKKCLFYGIKTIALLCAALSEPSASITRVRSDNTSCTCCLSKLKASCERIISNPSESGRKSTQERISYRSPKTASSTVTLLTAGKCKSGVVQGLPAVGWCHWKEYPINLQKK